MCEQEFRIHLLPSYPVRRTPGDCHVAPVPTPVPSGLAACVTYFRFEGSRPVQSNHKTMEHALINLRSTSENGEGGCDTHCDRCCLYVHRHLCFKKKKFKAFVVDSFCFSYELKNNNLSTHLYS